MDTRVTIPLPTGSPAHCSQSDWSIAYHDEKFQRLLQRKTSRIRPAVLLYFLTYILLSSLAGFAPQVMGAKLFGSFSLGYALILLTYAVAWTVALWYVRVAAQEFDPLRDEAVKAIRARGQLR